MKTLILAGYPAGKFAKLQKYRRFCRRWGGSLNLLPTDKSALFFGNDGGNPNQLSIRGSAVSSVLHLCHGFVKRCFGGAAAGLEVFEFRNPTEFCSTDFKVAALQSGVIFGGHVKAAAENENL